ncbi:hypothetical protein DVS77_28400 [Mycolicibacterium moriokaense]|nr:hypothetical protein DVS77_28400 [Mycolicibacterium moriokaense]
MSLITPEIRAALRLGEICGTFRYAVFPTDVERFVLGSADTGQAWAVDTPYVSGRLPVGTPAPPAAFIAFDPYERGDLDVEQYLGDIPYRATGGGNAYSEVRYTRPIRVGDDLVVDVTFTDIFEKRGHTGTLLFRTRSTRYTTAPEQGGELVAVTNCAHIRAFDTAQPGQVP